MQEGPKSMAMDGVAILSFIVLHQDKNINHRWDADIGYAAGTIQSLKVVLDSSINMETNLDINLRITEVSSIFKIKKCR